MSRALGDLQYKNPVNNVDDDSVTPRARRASSSSTPTEARGDFVSNEPFTSRRTLEADRRYLVVIVSDGVSDHTDDSTLVQHVMKLAVRGMRASDISEEISTTSARHASSDNASCIVAMLDGQKS